jgi:Protein of unknown function (DUF4231)
MDQEQYISQRLEDQIVWYEKKCGVNKKLSITFRAIEIACAAVIPFIAGSGCSLQYASIVTGFLGVVIAISAGISALNKYQENWISYRTTCELLKHEKYLFLTNTNPYDNGDAFNLLVQKVECLISAENSNWSVVLKKNENEKTSSEVAY